VLASTSAIGTTGLLASDMELPAALNGGYHLAFLIGASGPLAQARGLVFTAAVHLDGLLELIDRAGAAS